MKPIHLILIGGEHGIDCTRAAEVDHPLVVRGAAILLAQMQTLSRQLPPN